MIAPRPGVVELMLCDLNSAPPGNMSTRPKPNLPTLPLLLMYNMTCSGREPELFWQTWARRSSMVCLDPREQGIRDRSIAVCTIARPRMANITDVHEDTSSDLSWFLAHEVAPDGYRKRLLRVLACPRIRSCMPEWEGHQDQIRERHLLAASLVACVPSSPSPIRRMRGRMRGCCCFGAAVNVS